MTVVVHRTPQHRLRLLAALLVALVISGLVLPSAHAADGTVGGNVTEAGSGAPLGGVLVTAFCWDPDDPNVGEVCGETQTVADGSYSLALAFGSSTRTAANRSSSR